MVLGLIGTRRPTTPASYRSDDHPAAVVAAAYAACQRAGRIARSNASNNDLALAEARGSRHHTAHLIVLTVRFAHEPAASTTRLAGRFWPVAVLRLRGFDGQLTRHSSRSTTRAWRAYVDYGSLHVATTRILARVPQPYISRIIRWPASNYLIL